jgi:uncharacterized protein (DUF3820 family)
MQEEEIDLTRTERSMLAEVADWHRGAHETFRLTKGAKAGIYSCHSCFTYNGRGVLVELTEAEALLFNRHMTFPASLADLMDLPRRVRVAKLLSLIE